MGGRTNRSLKRLAAVAVTTLLMLGIAAGTDPAPVAATAIGVSGGPAPLKVIPVAGSAKYLVYGEYFKPAGGIPHTDYFVLDSSGQTRSISTVVGAYGFSLAGSMLIYRSDAYDNYRVGWVDLVTGESGSAPRSSQSPPWVVAAAPDGWIWQDWPDASHSLADQPIVGPARPLNGPRYGDPTVFSGANQLVAFTGGPERAESIAKVRVMSFERPGVWRTVLDNVPMGESEGAVNCGSVTNRYLTCTTLSPKKFKTVVRLIPLAGGHGVRTTRGCPGAPAVMGNGAAWVTEWGNSKCGERRVVLMSHDGTVTVTKYMAHNDPVSALGGAVVARRGAHQLLLFTTKQTKPKVLVHT